MNKIIFTNDVSKELKLTIENYSTSKIFIFTDDNTSKYCYHRILPAFEQEPVLIEIPAGEKMKNIDTANFLWNLLSTHNAERTSLMINLGGGVITDLGGFVASTYKRGIDFINVPTSLLGMIDASIGGKNGINFNNLKNHIGLYNNPKINIISAEFLDTLPEDQMVSGFAELVNHSLLTSQEEWNKIKSINPENVDLDYLQSIIKRSAEIKIRIVDSDPDEKDCREALNFGHTIGHAIESFFTDKNVPILHGEAVAIGLIAELFLSNKNFMFDFKKLFEVVEYLATYFKSFEIKFDEYEQIYEFMKQDKKIKKIKLDFHC